MARQPKRNAMDIALRLALPILGLLLIVLAMAILFFRPDLADRRLLATGGLGVLLFLSIFLTWEKGNLLNYLHLAIHVALVAGCYTLVYRIVDNRARVWDLTSDRIHSLSPQTLEYLKKLPQPVRIVGFVEKDSLHKAEGFLELYRLANPARVHVRAHDVMRDSLVAHQYDPNVYPGDFYVIRLDGDGEEKRKKVTLGLRMENAESQITNALVEIMRDQETKVYFLTGHGEKPLRRPADLPSEDADVSLSKLRIILEERAFPAEELNLIQRGSIPDDAALVVIPGPLTDLFDLERDLLADYLDDGGKLFVLFDPQLERGLEFPNLRRLLSPYGIETPGNAMVIDLASAQMNIGALTPIVQEFGTHPILRGVPRQPFYLREARPIDVAPSLPPGITAQVLLKTGPAAWSTDVDALIASGMRVTKPDTGLGPQPLAVAAERAANAQARPTRLVVVGDSDAFTNVALDSLAATFFFQACNWLVEQEDLLAIPPKTHTETPLALERGALLLVAFALGLLVMLVLFGGLGFTVLRRKLG